MLRHSSDGEPGYSRKSSGVGWQYFDEDGAPVSEPAEIERLNAIALPPAYTDAWFCKDANGHIQATGKDARGRKQYRYHVDYRARQEASKYERCVDFGKSLPKLRRRVERDLRRRNLVRETVLAAVVRLLDTAYLRVGNDQYSKANKSFGATTLRNRHVRKNGHRIAMRFKGKHGIEREVTITDRSLGRIVRRCQDLPGQALFQYVNGDGIPRPITSADVNDYIREATGGDFTAKHFRTWGASALACEQLIEKADGEPISLQALLEPVAQALGNTPAISRKSYVHPALLEAVKDNPSDPLSGLPIPRQRKRLSKSETVLLAFLEKSGTRRRQRAA